MATTNPLTPPGYRARLIENRLDILMKSFGCVEITGPKWCGKTWTALSRSASVTRLDEPAAREAAELDADLALVGEIPHLVDEWQEVPPIWDAARRQVDRSGNARGQLILTGSSVLSTTERRQIRHSGTGRIAKLHMRPMTLAESGDSSATVSLAKLLNHEVIAPTNQPTRLVDVARWVCRGGWPANIDMSDTISQETASQYIHSAIDINVVEEGYSTTTALSLMRALAMNQSQAVTYKTLSKDMARGETGPDESTITSYLDLLDRLFLTENLTGWEPPMRSKARVRIKPKRYFTDPSLGAALIGATPDKLLKDTQTLGMLFEALVLRDIRVFLSSYQGLAHTVSYYRDDKGLEVDLIIEHESQWAGLEIKLSDTKIDEAVMSLQRLRTKVSSNPAARNAEPIFLAVIVGKGNLAYTRPDGIHVIPMATLTA